MTLLSYFVPRKVSLSSKQQMSQAGNIAQVQNNVHHRISVPRKTLIPWDNNMAKKVSQWKVW